MKTRYCLQGTKGSRVSGSARRVGVVEAPEEWLGSLLLLCLGGGGMYEHHLEETLGELGVGKPRPGEMQRTLWRMEREGLVFCDREGGGYSIPRRFYQITEDGETYLELFTDLFEPYRGEHEARTELANRGLGNTVSLQVAGAES